MAKANIRPDATNANKGTERGRYMVETSLRETGAGRSILLDADGRIIAGNKTFEAATDIGLPVRIVETDGTELIAVQRTDLDLSDPTGTARKLAYYDNRASQVGLEWDAEQVLADITAGVDLDAMFSQREIDELLADLLPKTDADAEPQIDRAEELNKVWQVQPGDVWVIGDHRLVCGDCTNPAVVEKVMGGELADFCVTSPPYPSAEMWETDSPELIRVGNDCLRILRDVLHEGAALAWNTSDVPTGKGGVACNPARDTMTALELGYTKRAEIIWEKGLSYLPLPWNTRRPTVPNSTHESILIFFNGERKARETDGNLDTDALAWNRETVWDMGTAKAKQTNHKAAFPAELAIRCVTLFSFPDDVIYEPFCGSGTTFVACQNLGRRGRGIEISPSYCAVILQRMQDAFGIVGVRMDSQVNT